VRSREGRRAEEEVGVGCRCVGGEARAEGGDAAEEGVRGGDAEAVQP